MSDMIDRLSEIANDAGADAGTRLTAENVTASLATRVRRDVRRRRAVTSALAAAVVVLGAAAAVVLPHVLDPVPVVPAGDTRVPVETNEGLITYNDGSMQVLTYAGSVVEVPAPAEGAPTFAQETKADACSADPGELKPGWTAQFQDAFQLVTFGRALSLDATGYHPLPQGQNLVIGDNYENATVAFSVDVDPAIAPYVVMTMSSYLLAPNGLVAYHTNNLESRPAVEYTGDPDVGTYTATLTTRGVSSGYECDGLTGTWDGITPLTRYLVVSVFLNDGKGHVNPIATHSSWSTIVKESA